MENEMNREMFDRLVDNVEDLHAEIDAIGAILVGVCAALEKRDLPLDIVADAFDFAEAHQRRMMEHSDAMALDLARRTEGKITADP